MKICRAKTEDAERIAKLLVESWQYTYKGIMTDELLENLSVEKRRLGWEKHLQEGGEAYLAREEGALVGLVELSQFRDSFPAYKDYAEIPVIYLSPRYIGRGFGQQLLAYAEDELIKRDLRDVAIWVLAKNLNAIRFYKKMGYSKTDEEKVHPNTGLIEHLYVKHLPPN